MAHVRAAAAPPERRRPWERESAARSVQPPQHGRREGGVVVDGAAGLRRPGEGGGGCMGAEHEGFISTSAGRRGCGLGRNGAAGGRADRPMRGVTAIHDARIHHGRRRHLPRGGAIANA